MRFWDLLLPKHSACCDLANEAHIELQLVLRRLDDMTRQRDQALAVLQDQIELTEHLVEFLRVLKPGDLP